MLMKLVIKLFAICICAAHNAQMFGEANTMDQKDVLYWGNEILSMLSLSALQVRVLKFLMLAHYVQWDSHALLCN